MIGRSVFLVQDVWLGTCFKTLCSFSVLNTSVVTLLVFLQGNRNYSLKPITFMLLSSISRHRKANTLPLPHNGT